MASNYWESTQHRFWEFTKEQLAAMRQRRHDEERTLVQLYALPEPRHLNIFLNGQMLRLSKRLNLRQQPFATAQIYLKRFYSRVEIRRTNPYLVMATVLYLACKTEECPQHIRQIVQEAKALWPDQAAALELTRVGECEFFVISELRSHLIVHLPYRTLSTLQGELGLSSEEVAQAWSIVNDSFMTDLPLLYAPHIIAVTALMWVLLLQPNMGPPQSSATAAAATAATAATAPAISAGGLPVSTTSAVASTMAATTSASGTSYQSLYLPPSTLTSLGTSTPGGGSAGGGGGAGTPGGGGSGGGPGTPGMMGLMNMAGMMGIPGMAGGGVPGMNNLMQTTTTGTTMSMTGFGMPQSAQMLPQGQQQQQQQQQQQAQARMPPQPYPQQQLGLPGQRAQQPFAGAPGAAINAGSIPVSTTTADDPSPGADAASRSTLMQWLVKWLAESGMDLDATIDCTQELISFYMCNEEYDEKRTREQVNRFVKARALDR